MRKKTDFEKEAIHRLDNLGYKIFTENQISASNNSKPDLIAIRNNEALVIEAKSEAEAHSASCLSWSDNISKWRKYCKENYSRDIAIWMVHIGGQIKSQNQRMGNKKGFWHLKEFELDKYNTIPCLICPLSYKGVIEVALSNLKITEYQLIELSDETLLVKLTNKKQLNEIKPI